MAQLITNNDDQLVNGFFAVKTLSVAIVSGLLFWLLSIVIKDYIINPVYCNSEINSLTCSNSVIISGDISSILVAVVGIVVMVKKKMHQPLIISLATMISLWGLYGFVSELSYVESIGWILLCYILAYLLFSWIAKEDRVWMVLILVAISLFVVRFVLYL